MTAEQLEAIIRGVYVDFFSYRGEQRKGIKLTNVGSEIVYLQSNK